MAEKPPDPRSAKLPLTMPKDPTDKIVALLSDTSVEKRIAAAIVLGELQAKGAPVLAGLVAMLESDTPALQRPALDALAQIGAGKVLASVFPLLSSRNEEVKSAAMRVLASLGEGVVKDIRARMDGASLWGEIWYVLTPMAVPGIASTLLLNVIMAWNEAFWTLRLSTDDAAPLTAFIASFSSPQGQFLAKLSAASVLAILPILLYPISKTLWTALDLSMHRFDPVDRTEIELP